MLEIIVRIVTEIVVYYLCIGLVRLLTFGWVRASDIPDRASDRSSYIDRDYDGAIVLRADLAAGIGFIMVCLIVAMLTYVYRNY